MSDITIIKERGQGRFGTTAKVVPNNPEAIQILAELICKDAEHFTIHFDSAEEMAEMLREKGLDVDIR